MNKKILLYSLLLILAFNAQAQNLTNIFTNVDTLYMAGATPGHLAPIDTNVTPIVSSSPCNTPQYNYSVATTYQNGKVIAIAHEGLLSNGNLYSYDNLPFLKNAIDWLNPGSKRVTLKEGWINNGNMSDLKNELIAEGYTFGTLTGNITSTTLLNTDILILGNDWNGTQPYLASELAALDGFVANGGSIFIAGLGWSWPQALSQYPMNAAANLFGFEFTTNTLNDPDVNINGAPLLYNFYPDNLNTTSTPYCPSPFVGTNFERGDMLRILRLAVSTTGEFTQQSGGAAATAQLIDQWLEEINDIYGREYCVRYELITNNDQLIYPDPATDPWGTLPTGSGGCTNANIILSQQANVIDNAIGAANYDISHVIAGSPFGGGCAGGLKSGVSGGLNIPVTRHEMGHQLAQSHTINHPGNSNYEPENGGWTIQGGNGHGHGHAVSYHQLANFLLNTIPTVGNKVPTGNSIPTVDAGADFAIPISTPFTLEGTATDADPNDSLTYVWDNMNRGIPQTIPVADDSQGALFMRLLPDTSSSRTFPQMVDVVANNNFNAQEQLPTITRIMDIRLTVNDHHKMMYLGSLINASGSNSDDVQITVAEAGPFAVTSQSTTGIVYNANSNQTVTWEVNGTDTLPINTQNVTISLSIDGGYTYPFILLNNTPNNGNAVVTLPNVSTSTARIKVAAADNIYFDINTQNFQIESTLANTDVESSHAQISVYPNPTNDFLQIDLQEELHFKVEIYNTIGQQVLSQLNTKTIDVTTINTGVYVLVITDLNSREVFNEKLFIR